ncbi:hypothetical protein AB5J56_39000 [Streptomyces sp. R21]|uniref:Uncharacterized protein n=1 Tax=Streptomyces sp. R21 TaxID=3238627 RepID=A0AB39PIX1_9ACTN
MATSRPVDVLPDRETSTVSAFRCPTPAEAAPDVPRLRDALLAWSTTWTPSATPFTRIAVPRPSYDIPAICGPDNDSNAQGVRALGHPAIPAEPRITSPDAPPGAPSPPTPS